MTITKRLLSVLLAAMLLFSALPMTAFAAETDTAAVEAEPSTVTYSISNNGQLKYYLELDDTDRVAVLNVTADFIGRIGTAGDSSDNSYVRYAITVGKGKKVLNLNGHKLNFYNDYSVIYDHFGAGHDETQQLNRLALFNIPEGADLTVNGDAEGSVDSGVIQYHGKLLYKCDAVDQRDIFEINGGNLTINSGNFVPGGESTSYTWKESIETLPGIYHYYDLTGWYIIHGDAIRAITGNLTINGGLFQGRGFNGYYHYGDERNAALYAEEGMNSVVINNGHFLGVSQANVFNARSLMESGRFVINSGLFEVDQNEAIVCTIYASYRSASDDKGMHHIIIKNPNPCVNYYYINPLDEPYYTEVSAEELNEDHYFLYTFRWQYVYIAPKKGAQVHSDLSYTPTGDLKLLYQGKEQPSVAYSTYWNKQNSLVLTVDPDTLYFPQQGKWDQGVTQSMTATVDIHSYHGEGERPLLAEGETVTVTKNSKGQYTIDLNSLRSQIKTKVLKESKTYELRFHLTENWKSRLEYSIIHEASYFITISETIRDVYLKVVEPAYGVRCSTDVDLGDSAEFCTASAAGEWVYQVDGSTNWQQLPAGQAFTNNRRYAISVMGTMKEGYALSESANIWVNGILADNLIVTSTGFMSTAYFDTHISPITEVIITDVPEPVSGGNPIYYARKPDGVHYTLDTKMSMYWMDPDGFTMAKYDKFEAGKKYTVKFNIATNDDYQFTEYLTAKINGNNARVTEQWKDYTGVYHARIEYSFICPEPAEPTLIEHITVNIAEPEVGGSPSYNATVPEDAGYQLDKQYNAGLFTNGVAWYRASDETFMKPGDVFEAGDTYILLACISPISDEYSFGLSYDDDDWPDNFDIVIGGQEGEVYAFAEETLHICTWFKMPGEISDKKYNLWVGSTQVTSNNKDDILSDGGSATYDPATHTLCLDEPTITGSSDKIGIIYAEDMDLTIDGKCKLRVDEITKNCVRVDGGTLTLQGTFEFIQLYNDCQMAAVSAQNGIIINSGMLYAESQHSPAIYVSGGKLTIGKDVISVEANNFFGGIDNVAVLAREYDISDELEIVFPEGCHLVGSLFRDSNGNDADYIVFVSKHMPPEPSSILLGDVDGDGEVTILDATTIQRHLAELSTLNFVEEAADADGDGEVSILDATAIQRWLAELPTNENIGKPITAAYCPKSNR